MVNRIEGQFEAVRNSQFVEDVVKMILYSLLADEQLFADFFVAEALGYLLDDFLFALTEQRFVALSPGFDGFREGFYDLGGHTVVQPDFSGVNAVNALDEKIRRGLFQNDAASAKTHS